MDDALEQKLAILRNDYASTLPDAIAAIDELWGQIGANDVPLVDYQDIIGKVHDITGAGAFFGLTAVSDAARRLEQALDSLHADGRLPEQADHEFIAALIVALRQSMD